MGAEGQLGSGLAQREEPGVALGCLVAALPDPSMELLCRFAHVCALSPPLATLLPSPGGPLSPILLDATIEGLEGAQLALPLVDFLLLEMHRSEGWCGVGWGEGNWHSLSPRQAVNCLAPSDNTVGFLAHGSQLRQWVLLESTSNPHC